MTKSSKTFLITGGAGFIGSSIAEKLHKKHKIIVLDNLTTGNMKNLEGLDVDFRKGHTKNVDKLVPEKVDLILHLGIASTTMLYLNNRKLVASEIEGSIAVFEKAVRDKAKVVIASSSSIYNGGKIPSKENQKIFVTDFYTECRLCIERLAELYCDLYGMKAVCLRMFSVYGGERDARKKHYANMITKFLLKMRKGENPVSYGDGTQTRDFTYIDDVVRAWILASKYKKFDIFNIGTGKHYTFNKVVDIINKEKGFGLEMKYEPNPLKNFVYHCWADTRRAKKYLGFKAKISLKEGIKNI